MSDLEHRLAEVESRMSGGCALAVAFVLGMLMHSALTARLDKISSRLSDVETKTGVRPKEK